MDSCIKRLSPQATISLRRGLRAPSSLLPTPRARSPNRPLPCLDFTEAPKIGACNASGPLNPQPLSRQVKPEIRAHLTPTELLVRIEHIDATDQVDSQRRSRAERPEQARVCIEQNDAVVCPGPQVRFFRRLCTYATVVYPAKPSSSSCESSGSEVHLLGQLRNCVTPDASRGSEYYHSTHRSLDLLW